MSIHFIKAFIGLFGWLCTLSFLAMLDLDRLWKVNSYMLELD